VESAAERNVTISDDPGSAAKRLSVETVDDDARLEAWAVPWAKLAEDHGAPCALPGWVLAWWRHARPEGALLRTIVVYEGDGLVGVAPFYAEGHRYRLLAAPLSEPVEPLAARGREGEVAAAIAAELAELEPRPCAVDLGTQWSTSDWSARLRDAWPESPFPWSREGAKIPVRVVTTEGVDLEGWLRALDVKQRSNLRRYRRRLDEMGARLRLSSLETLEADMAAFLFLHRARHADEETPLARPGVARMLIEAGWALIPHDQLRLICLDLGEQVIAAQLMLAAGGEVTTWNSGFDNAFAKLSPSLNTFVEGVSLAIERGDRNVDMGPDTADYKRRLTDAERTLVSRVLVPRGRGYLRTRARLALRLGI
jgi:CelD/BcsL family acetyltransferase involved in cellulose biosynthesis